MALARKHIRANIFYAFKVKQNQEEFLQRVQLAYRNISPFRTTVFSWFTEFSKGRNSLQDEERKKYLCQL